MKSWLRRCVWRVQDLVTTLPGLSLIALDVLARKPDLFPSFIGDVIRLRRSLLGQCLPPISVRDLIQHEGVYSVRFGIGGSDFDNHDGLLFAKLLVLLRPKRIFEIGTSFGLSARFVCRQSPDEVELFTLDIPPGEVAPDGSTDHSLIEAGRSRLGELYRGTEWEPQITQLYGDSATFDFSPYRDSMDLIYVDGSHSYTYVESDTRNAMNMIRTGGVILWDDYGSIRAEYGTTRYLEQMRSGGLPVFRLGSPGSSARYRRAVMRVDEETRARYEEWSAKRS